MSNGAPFYGAYGPEVAATKRHVSAQTRESGLAGEKIEAEDPFFNCNPNALEIASDDHERRQAGEGDVLGLEKAKTRTLISGAKVAHESAVFGAAASSLSAVAGIGVWGGETSTADPIAEIDALIAGLATQTGQMPNRIAIGLPAWRRLRHNPAVLERFPGAAIVGVTLNQFASLLLNPQIDIRVGVMSADTTKPGKTKNAANIIGSELYLFVAQQSPSVYDPSFMKTFRTRGGGVDMVRIYRAREQPLRHPRRRLDGIHQSHQQRLRPPRNM